MKPVTSFPLTLIVLEPRHQRFLDSFSQAVSDQLLDDADFFMTRLLPLGEGRVDHLVASDDIIDDGINVDRHSVTHDFVDEIGDRVLGPLARRVFVDVRTNLRQLDLKGLERTLLHNAVVQMTQISGVDDLRLAAILSW